MVIAGVDVGSKGAIAFISNHRAAVFNMPYVGDEVDVRLLDTVLREFAPTEIWVERVHAMPNQGVTSMFTFGRSYGMTLAVCRLRCEVTLVSPQVWKKATGVTSDKKSALGLARQLFPDVDLHWESKDGRAEALLIAEYGRRKVSND